MIPEKNKERVKKYYAAFNEGGDPPFEEFFSSDFIDRNGYPN